MSADLQPPQTSSGPSRADLEALRDLLLESRGEPLPDDATDRLREILSLLRDSDPDRLSTSYVAEHAQRMDVMRVRLSVLILFILAVVIIVGAVANGGLDGVSEITSPVSGLAGIAVGWLFSTKG